MSIPTYGQSNYAQNIGNVDINMLVAYNYFSWYFDNPTLKKFKVVGTQVMFGCRIRSMLMRDTKYLIAMVDVKNLPETEEIKLQELNWKCLQMRTLTETIQVPFCSYREKSNDISDSQITAYKKNDSMTCYECEKLKGTFVTLLYTKNQTRSYADTGILKNAIETYNTLITFQRE